MNNTQFLAWLKSKNACESAVKKLGKKSALQVWRTWDNPSDLLWWVQNSGVVSAEEQQRRAARIVRNTPIADGRTVWDLLTDDRSRAAVVAAETNTVTPGIIAAATDAAGEAGDAAAWAAAHAAAAGDAAAWAAVWAAEWDAAGEAGDAAAWAAAHAAARDAARAAVWAAEWDATARDAARAAARAAATDAVLWQCNYIREQLPEFIKIFTEKCK